MVSLNAVFNLFKQKAESKGLIFAFENNCNMSAVFVNTDPSRIKQIFSNVISNSIKFTDDGFVKVITEIVEGELLVHIEDSGVGIENIPTIFNAYTQEGSAASKSMGTGLGLSIVKTLCESLDIQLGVDSAPRCGTTFRFNLGQIIDTTPVNQKAIKKQTSDTLKKLDKKVLVVDDNDINLVIAQTMLGEQFHNVDIAKNGVTAIDLVKKYRDYDVVFIDLNMPEMDGIATSYAIRKLDIIPPPIIVAQTADATEATTKRLNAANIQHLLTKPFTQEKLTSIIDSLNLSQSRPQQPRSD